MHESYLFIPGSSLSNDTNATILLIFCFKNQGVFVWFLFNNDNNINNNMHDYEYSIYLLSSYLKCVMLVDGT